MVVDWREYRRRLILRDDRRGWVRRRAGWSEHPGEAHFHRSDRQLAYPQFGGQVPPAPLNSGRIRPWR